MTDIVQSDFAANEDIPVEGINLTWLIERLNEGGLLLRRHSMESIIDVLEAFADVLLDRNSALVQRYPNSGLSYIAHWCQRRNLENLIRLAFGNVDVLDKFVVSEIRSDRAYRLLPRGLIVHWMAGNVPTLGFLSLLQGILTKNANLIKLPRDSDGLLGDLMRTLAKVETSKLSGKVLTDAMAAVRYDHTRVNVGSALSQTADVRLMWGSDESIEQIQSLPKKVSCRDIVFGSKTSIIVIDKSSVDADDLSDIARRVAIDVSVFEQMACASPHTIFLETIDDAKVERFAEALHQSLNRILRTHPKQTPTERTIANVLNVRAKYDMFHQAWYSEGVEFTILGDDDLKIGPAVGSRTIYLRKADPLESLVKLLSSKVQSVGIQAEPERFDAITNAFAEAGVQRFTSLGTMTNFESPWDGYLILHSLVRWASRPASIDHPHG